MLLDLRLDDSEDQLPEDPFADKQGHIDGLVKQIDLAYDSIDYLNADDDHNIYQTYGIHRWREYVQ